MFGCEFEQNTGQRVDMIIDRVWLVRLLLIGRANDQSFDVSRHSHSSLLEWVAAYRIARHKLDRLLVMNRTFDSPQTLLLQPIDSPTK